MTKTKTKSVGKRTGIGPEGHAVLADLVALKAMTVPELPEKWAAIFDAPAPKTSRQNLELRLGYRIQELASGEPGQMVSDSPRPMPGTKLVREWNGVEHSVTVLAKGFEWQDRRYKSLSGAARAITGANWNARTGTAGSSSASAHARGSGNDAPNTAASAPSPALRHLHPQVERGRA